MTEANRHFTRNITLVSVFGIPIITALIWIGSTMKGIDDYHQIVDIRQQAQDTVNVRQQRFNSRQLQYDELFRAQFQHLGHILSKIDTGQTYPVRKRK